MAEKTTNPFYRSSKWKITRERVLKRDRFLCQECKRYGKRIDADTVHHIYPMEDRPDLKLVDYNLISLCVKCHNSMHDRNTDRLTIKGEELKNRAPLPQDEKI